MLELGTAEGSDLHNLWFLLDPNCDESIECVHQFNLILSCWALGSW